MRRRLALLEDWRKWLFRPIAVRLLTGLVLFLLSLTFSPVRQWLFPPGTIAYYPLICTAEPHVLEDGKTLAVELFIINRTKDAYSREDLLLFLEDHKLDPESKPTPDIELEYTRLSPDGEPIGRVVSVDCGGEFNRDKGELACSFDESTNVVTVRVMGIKPRAVMSVTIHVEGLPITRPESITRMTKSAIPFDYERYQDACYTRGY